MKSDKTRGLDEIPGEMLEEEEEEGETVSAFMRYVWKHERGKDRKDRKDAVSCKKDYERSLLFLPMCKCIVV